MGLGGAKNQLARGIGRQGWGGQRQAGEWLGAGENRYRGHVGSRFMLCLDRNAIKNSSLP